MKTLPFLHRLVNSMSGISYQVLQQTHARAAVRDLRKQCRVLGIQGRSAEGL